MAKNHAHRTDRFYRWVWTEEGEYTLELTHGHADEFLIELADEDYTDSNWAKCYRALVALYEWLEESRGLEPWEPVMSYYERGSTTQPRDFLTREEPTAKREAALDYGSIPSYYFLTPAARDRWKAHLAQRFEKPKAEVTPAHWERANGWKIPSLVAASLDCGLRPVEVERGDENLSSISRLSCGFSSSTSSTSRPRAVRRREWMSSRWSNIIRSRTGMKS